MTRFHQVPLAEVRAERWRNGGGITHTLLAWPPGSDGMAWTLRVSVARIERDGAFSRFENVERWFAVLEGGGVRLDLARGTRSIAALDEPIAFDGDDAPMCELIEGPTLDLNLMCERGAGRARMWRARAGSTIDAPTAWRGLYAVDAVQLEIDGVTDVLPAHTLAWSDASEAAPWCIPPRSSGAAYWMSLER